MPLSYWPSHILTRPARTRVTRGTAVTSLRRGDRWLTGLRRARGEFGAGGGHGERDEALAGWLVHMSQALDGEPIQQGGKAEGEVLDRSRRGEFSLPHAAGDDRGQLVAP